MERRPTRRAFAEVAVRGMWIVAVGMMMAAPSLVAAQELSGFAGVGPRGGNSKPLYGGGASLAGFVRLGSILGSDMGRYQESQILIGLRGTLNKLGASEFRDYSCNSPFEPCVYNPRTVHTRLAISQLTLELIPVRSRMTRLELGGGVSGFVYRGEPDETGPGLVATIAVSRRLGGRNPLWMSAGYEVHRWQQVLIADAGAAVLPDRSLRIGLFYDFLAR